MNSIYCFLVTFLVVGVIGGCSESSEPLVFDDGINEEKMEERALNLQNKQKSILAKIGYLNSLNEAGIINDEFSYFEKEITLREEFIEISEEILNVYAINLLELKGSMNEEEFSLFECLFNETYEKVKVSRKTLEEDKLLLETLRLLKETEETIDNFINNLEEITSESLNSAESLIDFANISVIQ